MKTEKHNMNNQFGLATTRFRIQIQRCAKHDKTRGDIHFQSKIYFQVKYPSEYCDEKLKRQKNIMEVCKNIIAITKT